MIEVPRIVMILLASIGVGTVLFIAYTFLRTWWLDTLYAGRRVDVTVDGDWGAADRLRKDEWLDVIARVTTGQPVYPLPAGIEATCHVDGDTETWTITGYDVDVTGAIVPALVTTIVRHVV